MGRPYITLSWGQTLDGRLATATGDSQWIGGPESLQFAHELRRDNEAILVGIGTVLKDNPRLTCRIPGGRNPLRVVLDAHLRLPPTAALASTAEAPTLVYTLAGPGPGEASAPRRALEAQGVTVVTVAGHDGRLDLGAVVDDLANRGVATLFVEGGAAVLTAFLAAGLADRAVVVTAPFLLGAGIEAVGDLGHRVLAQAPRPRSWRRWDLGDDLATELVFS
jgi:riboflavin-specific deaminase-like protein